MAYEKLKFSLAMNRLIEVTPIDMDAIGIRQQVCVFSSMYILLYERYDTILL